MISIKDIDLLLYVPHDNTNWESIDEVLRSLVSPQVFSRELLTRYMLHEADRWAFAVAQACYNELMIQSPELQVVVQSVNIPRAWCDLNRPWERAVPSALHSEIYQESYQAQLRADYALHERAKRAVHIHTMCGRSPVMQWAFTENTTEADMEEFLDACYSGDDRHIDLLTHTLDGEQIADLDFAEKIWSIYRQAGFYVDQNGAYQLKSGYPATELMRICSSVLIEYPKNLLATNETEYCIDTSQIILDAAKIERMAKLLAKGLLEVV